ncbi:helix-hairpin-helix domain-containing protein [Nocardiopsis coralliicola]
MAEDAERTRAALAGMGAPETLAAPLAAALGPDAAEQLAADPWRLLALPGVTLDQADYCARQALGEAATPGDPRRGRAVVARVLARAARSGSTAVAEADLVRALHAVRITDTDPAIAAAVDDGTALVFEALPAEDGAGDEDEPPAELPEPERFYASEGPGLAEQDLGEGAARLLGTAEAVMDPATAAEAVAAAGARLGAPIPAETAAAAVTALRHGVAVLHHGSAHAAAVRQTVAVLAQAAADSGVGLAVTAPTAQATAHLTSVLGDAMAVPGAALPADGAAETPTPDPAPGPAPEGAGADGSDAAEGAAGPARTSAAAGGSAADSGSATAAEAAGGSAAPAKPPRTDRVPSDVDATAKAAADLQRLLGGAPVPAPDRAFAASLSGLSAPPPPAPERQTGPAGGRGSEPRPARSRLREHSAGTAADLSAPVPLARLLDAGSPVRAGIVVVAAAMALDVERAAELVEACDDGTHLVLLADPAEAPSARPGRVPADLAESGQVAVAELPSDGGGPLADLAAAVAGGDLAPATAPDREVVVVPAESGAEAVHRAVQLIGDSIPRAVGIAAGHIQIVAAARGGDAGTDALNRACKERFNPGPGAIGGLDPGDRVALAGDGPGYTAGDTGVLREPGGDGRPRVALADGTEPAVDPAVLRPGWAVTIAAAHGGRWPAVVAVFGPDTRGSRPQVYTALTRATRHLSIVQAAGPGLSRAVAERPGLPRTTRLTAVVREG